MKTVEERNEGIELVAWVPCEKAVPLLRNYTPQGKYDYENKYFTDDTKYYCPSGIAAELEARIHTDTLRAFRVLGCRGWGRADLMLRSDGSYAFLELNTSPGMTGHSLVPMAAKQAGLPFADPCVAILRLATL